MRTIYTPRLIDTLPQSLLADEEFRAAAESLDLELEKLSADVEQVLHLPRLDKLPSEVLDFLAWQYHVDFYEPTKMDLETKRKLIRESIFWHRIKGTPAAIEKLAKVVFKSAKIEEWFEYDENKPYYFRITSKGLFDNGDEDATFFRLIYATKNERSWLDDLLFDLTVDGVDLTIYAGAFENSCGLVEIETADVFPETKENNIYFGLFENFGGYVELDTTIDLTTRENGIFAGAVEVSGGFVEFEFDKTIEITTKENNNVPAILEQFGGYVEFDCEISDYEDFPTGVDFLRLYYAFTPGDVHYFTLLNPRADVEGEDVKEIDKMIKTEKLLKKEDAFADGVKKALLVSKSEFNFF